MLLPIQGRFAVFIEGSNLYATAKSLGFDMDYKKLLSVLQEHGTLVRAYYYTAQLPPQEDGLSKLQPLIDWLDYNGYTVVKKQAKEFVDARGDRKIKGNMDIEMTVDMLKLSRQELDYVVLFTGDGDFVPVVKAVQEEGVRVVVVSSIETKPSPMIADELRRQADDFIDLKKLQEVINRPLSEQRTPSIRRLSGVH